MSITGEGAVSNWTGQAQDPSSWSEIVGITLNGKLRRKSERTYSTQGGNLNRRVEVHGQCRGRWLFWWMQPLFKHKQFYKLLLAYKKRPTEGPTLEPFNILQFLVCVNLILFIWEFQTVKVAFKLLIIAYEWCDAPLTVPNSIAKVPNTMVEHNHHHLSVI